MTSWRCSFFIELSARLKSLNQPPLMCELQTARTEVHGAHL